MDKIAVCECFGRCEGGTLFLPKSAGRDRAECDGAKSFFQIQQAEGILHGSSISFAPMIANQRPLENN